MAKDDLIRMPSSMGGLVQYFDDYKSKISFRPVHLIIIAVIIIALVLVLHVFGNSWLGIA